RLAKQRFALERSGEQSRDRGNGEQQERRPESEQVDRQPPQAQVELNGDPDAAIIQEPAYDGGERRAAAVTEQEDEAHAPGQDDEGCLSDQIERPERRAEKGTQKKPGQDH